MSDDLPRRFRDPADTSYGQQAYWEGRAESEQRIKQLEDALREEAERYPIVDEQIYHLSICRHCDEVADHASDVTHSEDCWWIRVNELLSTGEVKI